MDHLLITGHPDAGITKFARDAAKKFPFPSRDSAIDRGYINRITGLKLPGELVPPFRAPHHTVSRAALSGTFRRGYILQPGELSIAHGGTLFLDDIPEFRRDSLDQVINAVTLGHVPFEGAFNGVAYNVSVPARFRLICAMMPCPCGWSGTSKCRCSDETVNLYGTRIPQWFRDNCREMTLIKEV